MPMWNAIIPVNTLMMTALAAVALDVCTHANYQNHAQSPKSPILASTKYWILSGHSSRLPALTTSTPIAVSIGLVATVSERSTASQRGARRCHLLDARVRAKVCAQAA